VERDRNARPQPRGKFGRESRERGKVDVTGDVRGHGATFAERIVVLLRFSDVVVGIVAGAVCSVLAAAFEAGILFARVFSIGRVGGGFGSGVVFIALSGALVGGIVGLLVGALFNRRDLPSRAQ
jgi:hypothetical protein